MSRGLTFERARGEGEGEVEQQSTGCAHNLGPWARASHVKLLLRQEKNETNVWSM